MTDDKENEALRGEIKSLSNKIERIERIFYVAATVAAIFGLGGAFGATALINANQELKTLETSIEEVEKKVNKIDTAVSDAVSTINQTVDQGIQTIQQQKQEAITPVVVETLASSSLIQKLGNEVTMLQAKQLKIGDQVVQGCNNPRSGRTLNCSCEQEKQILVGVQHADVEGDNEDTEQIVGIICRTLSLE